MVGELGRLDRIPSDDLVEYLTCIDQSQLIRDRKEELLEYVNLMRKRSAVTPPNIIIRCIDGLNVSLDIWTRDLL